MVVTLRGYTPRPFTIRAATALVHMAAILFKVTLALATGLLGAWALRTRLPALSERGFLAGALGLQLIPALALFVGLYVLGHREPTSDIPSYYVPAGRAVLAGQVPFRDFSLSYAPAFAYVGAAILWVWNSPKAFSLFAILVNSLALVWWHWAATAWFDRRTARHCTVFYATSGHVLVQTLLGTNQVWVGAGLAASALLLARGRDGSSGLAQAITAGTTKVLAYLFWPLLWICARHRARWLLAATVPTVLLYGVFIYLGAGPGLLYPLQHEGAMISPGNLPYLLDFVLGVSGGPLGRHFFDGLLLTALGAATLWIYGKARLVPPTRRQALLLAGLALTGVIFMLFSKKSFTGYVTFTLYPLLLMLVLGQPDNRIRVVFLLALNVLLAAEPSIWFYLGGNPLPLREWLATSGGAKVAGFVLVDLCLLAGYVYLAWLSVRGIGRMADGAIEARNPNQSATACSVV